MPFFNETVPAEFTGTERLDKYLSSLPNAMNRSKLKSGIIELLVNEKKAKLNSKIKAGDKIYFQWEDSIPDDIEPQNIPLDIIYEDENVTVVNKAQGIVTHPAARIQKLQIICQVVNQFFGFFPAKTRIGN